MGVRLDADEFTEALHDWQRMDRAAAKADVIKAAETAGTQWFPVTADEPPDPPLGPKPPYKKYTGGHMRCIDCGVKSSGRRCRKHSTIFRRKMNAELWQAVDLDLITRRARHQSFEDIARVYRISRQRVNERLWIAVRRLGITTENLHPDVIKAAIDQWMVEQIGTSIYRLPKSSSGGSLTESGNNPADEGA